MIVNDAILFPSITSRLPQEITDIIIKQTPQYRTLNQYYAKDKETYRQNYCHMSFNNVLHYLNQSGIDNFIVYADNHIQLEYVECHYSVHKNLHITHYKATLVNDEIKQEIEKNIKEIEEYKDYVIDVLRDLYERYTHIHYDLKFTKSVLNYFKCYNIMNVKDYLIKLLEVYPYTHDPIDATEYFNNVKAFLYLYTVDSKTIINVYQLKWTIKYVHDLTAELDGKKVYLKDEIKNF